MSEKKNDLLKMKNALENLRDAFIECDETFNSSEFDCNDYITNEKGRDKYPFNMSFDEMSSEVDEWVWDCIYRINVEVGMKIKNAMANYTGGGIYIYYGQMEDGNYFRACDEWECIEICASDTSVEEADYPEFYDKYKICTLVGKQYEIFWNRMLVWIINNAPSGNYSNYELKTRIIKRREGFRTIKITAGMTQEFEIISTNAPDSVIKANMQYISSCEENGECIENPYVVIESMGYIANVLGCQDDLGEDDMETAIIDAEFDYYEL